jgi:uncharacterized lipoprotein NlpE involved in copper resistance
MKKILAFSLVALALAGCDNRPLDQHDYTKSTMTNIPELADCVYIRVGDVRIVRCPHSDTTVTSEVPQGKSRKTIVTTVISEDKK